MQRLDLVAYLKALLILVGVILELYLLPVALPGPQLFPMTIQVVRDQAIRRLNYVFGGSVVLFELYDHSRGVYLLELEDELATGPAEPVYHLVIIANACQLLRLGSE